MRLITSKTRNVLTLFAGSHEVAPSAVTGLPMWQPIPGASDFTHDAWLHAAIAHCRRIGNQLLALRTRAGAAEEEMRRFHQGEHDARNQTER